MYVYLALNIGQWAHITIWTPGHWRGLTGGGRWNRWDIIMRSPAVSCVHHNVATCPVENLGLDKYLRVPARSWSAAFQTPTWQVIIRWHHDCCITFFQCSIIYFSHCGRRSTCVSNKIHLYLLHLAHLNTDIYHTYLPLFRSPLAWPIVIPRPEHHYSPKLVRMLTHAQCV
jgi:hypothetical protein